MSLRRLFSLTAALACCLFAFYSAASAQSSAGDEPTAEASCLIGGLMGAVNMRSAPGLAYPVVGRMGNAFFPVLARSLEGGWYQVNVLGQMGGVSASTTVFQEDCAAQIPIAARVDVPTPTPPKPTVTPASDASPTPVPKSVGLPDLRVDIEHVERGVDDPENVYVTFTITNVGTGSVDEGIWYYYTVCLEQDCGSDTTMGAPLLPGESIQPTLVVAHAPLPDGEVSAVFVNVDPTLSIEESNEDNNITVAAVDNFPGA